MNPVAETLIHLDQINITQDKLSNKAVVSFLNKGTTLITVTTKTDFNAGDILIINNIKLSMELFTR